MDMKLRYFIGDLIEFVSKDHWSEFEEYYYSQGISKNEVAEFKRLLIEWLEL